MDATDLSTHIFDTGVAMNRVLAKAFEASGGGILPHIYLVVGKHSYATLGIFSTREKAEAVAKKLDFETTIQEEVVY